MRIRLVVAVAVALPAFLGVLAEPRERARDIAAFSLRRCTSWAIASMPCPPPIRITEGEPGWGSVICSLNSELPVRGCMDSPFRRSLA